MVLWCWKFLTSLGKNRKLNPRLIDIIAEKGRIVHIFASKKDFVLFLSGVWKISGSVCGMYICLVSWYWPGGWLP